MSLVKMVNMVHCTLNLYAAIFTIIMALDVSFTFAFSLALDFSCCVF